MTDRTCGGCEHWVRVDKALGECRIDPPQPEYPKGVFPLIVESKWCGKYQRKGLDRQVARVTLNDLGTPRPADRRVIDAMDKRPPGVPSGKKDRK